MADDHNSRYRADHYHDENRPADQPANASDPLAELARLIGRNDPFAEHGRSSEPPHQDYGSGYHDRPHQYGQDDGYVRQYHAQHGHAQHDHAPAYRDDPHAGYDSRHHGGQDPAGYDQQPRYDSDGWPGAEPQAHAHAYPHAYAPAPAEPHGHAEAYDPFAPPLRQTPQHDRRDTAHFPTDPFGNPAQHAVHSHAEADASYGDAHRPDFHQDPAYAVQADRDHGEPHALQPPPFMHAGPPGQPHEMEEESGGRRRRGMVTIVAVVLLAVVGTAGAFAYRTLFGGTVSSGPPPVIRASAEPSKVAPPAATSEPSNKISYDRFGDRGQDERVVSREEKPLDPKAFANATTTAVRNPLPRALDSTSTAASPPVPQAQPGSLPPSVLTEPRRVRTVPIRPDQPDPMSRPQTAAPAPAPQPQRQVASAPPPAQAPLDVSPRASAQPSFPPPQAAPRQAPQPSASAPLSLVPDGNGGAAPARPLAVPPRLASTPPSRGGYLVQVSSQRSEADAQTSYRSLQSRYSGVLGDRQAVIRRADLGDRGTYYRAMVGPFQNRDEAIQLCTSLKQAGGDCVVQSN